MFAIRCPYPYCQHENQPGARFCAACGAPLHLKPCPKCGKVDDVTAKRCSACDTVFPPIKLAPFGDGNLGATELNAPSGSHPSAPAPVGNSGQPHTQTQFNRALPLIVIALFAGGIPFLWMNKSWIPTPQSSIAPPPATPKALPAAAPAATQPGQQAVTPPLAATPLPVPTATAGAQVTAAQPSPASTTGNTAPVAKKSQPKPHKAKTESAEKPPAAAEPPPQRPCTEGVAALGLCERGQGAK